MGRWEKDSTNSKILTTCLGNPWPSDLRNQDLGRWELANFYKAIRGISWKLLRALDMPAEEIEDLVEKVKFDMTNLNRHFCFPM